MTVPENKKQKETIYTWLVDIPPNLDSLDVTLFLNLLNEEEKERFQKMGSEKRKVEYLLGHVLARVKVAEVFGGSLRDVDLRFEEGGRPVVCIGSRYSSLVARSETRNENRATSIERREPSNEQRFISLTHSKSLLAVAVAGCPVGIDIEENAARENFEAVAKREFSEVEFEELISLSSEKDKRKHFTQLWTLKEALRKACDGSWKQVFKETRFRVGAAERDVIPAEAGIQMAQLDSRFRGNDSSFGNPTPWQFFLKEIKGEHTLAVACKNHEEVEIKVVKVSSEQLRNELIRR